MSLPITIMNKLKILKLVAAAFLLGSTSQAQVIFQDNFNNGIIANSDTITGYWTNAPGAVWTHSESGGFFSGSTPTSTGTAHTEIYGAMDSSIGFFSQEKTYSVRLDADGLNGAATGKTLRFSLMSGNQTFTADDSISLAILNSNVIRMGAAQNEGTATPSASPEALGNLLALTTLTSTNPITGFDLTLNSTSYSLTMLQSGVATQTFSGNHNLSLANWGDGVNDVTRAAFRATRTSGSAMSFDIDSYTVQTTAVPEPASVGTWSLIFLGMAFLRKKIQSVR
jgi:hypothetical protein